MSIVTRTINKDGNKLNVTLAVEITEGETYYLIDERYPTDFKFVEASNNGFNLEGSNTVKWVVIMGAQDMEYTYTVEIPEGTPKTNTFNGTYMFEGDVTEKTIAGKATVSVKNGAVGIHNSMEDGVRKAVRDVFLACDDAEEKVEKFEKCVKVVAVNSTKAANDNFRFDEHKADWACAEAVEDCDYMMSISTQSQATVNEYLTLDVPTKGMFAKSMRKNAVKAVKIHIRLQKLIAEYNALHWIAIRAVKMEINACLQKEEDARAIGDKAAQTKAALLKRAAQKKVVAMHNAHKAKYGIKDPVVGFGGAAAVRAAQAAKKAAHKAAQAALRAQAAKKAVVDVEQAEEQAAEEIVGVIYDKDGMHELRGDGEPGRLILAQKDYVLVKTNIVTLEDRINAQLTRGI